MITSNLAKTLRKAQEDAKLRGLEEGIEQGIEQGIEKGSKEKQVEIARKMLQRNLPLETVVEITELPIAEVRNLYKEIFN